MMQIFLKSSKLIFCIDLLLIWDLVSYSFISNLIPCSNVDFWKICLLYKLIENHRLKYKIKCTKSMPKTYTNLLPSLEVDFLDYKTE